MTGPIKAEQKILDISVSNGQTFITLKAQRDTQTLGVQSLFWNSRRGHLLVQFADLGSEPNTVLYRVVRNFGSVLPRTGDFVSLSGWLGEKPEHFGISEYQQVELANGTRAWQFEGNSSNWVIHVHGRRAMMGETLRNLNQFKDLGFSQLTLSMATDPKPFGLGKAKSTLGHAEWLEIEQAVEYALAQGAKQITLFGWSQGALISGLFLKNSDKTDSVVRAIFDSPLLDYRSTMRFHADRQGVDKELGDRVIDGIFTNRLFKLFGYSNVDVDKLSLAKNTIGKEIPILVLHSARDGHVEIQDVHKFAELNSKVSLVEIEGAKHCRLYNHDEMKYKESIANWLKAN